MIGLLALNVASPSPEAARALLEYLWHRDEQVWVLSELTRGRGSRLVLDVCRAAGHRVAATPPDQSGSAGRGVAVVVTDPGLEVNAAAPTGPRLVEVEVAGVRVLGVYGAASDPVRYSDKAQRARKRAWLEDFVATVEQATSRPGPLVVAGDLNIVDPDDVDGLRHVLPEERAAYDRLTEMGLDDAYRAAHHGSRVTWVDHSGVGCRYDHVFTRDANVLAVDIDDSPRLAAHSDHSAIWAHLARD